MKRSLTSPLTAQEVTSFIEARIPADRRACPRCGADDWHLVGNKTDEEILGLPVVDREQEQTGLYAAIVLNCGRCGFVSIHAKQVVLDWLDKGEK